MDNIKTDFDLSQFYTRRTSKSKSQEAEEEAEVMELGGNGNVELDDGGTRIMSVDEQAAMAHRLPRPNGELCGFLFSVSRGVMGEYWPLCMGDNTIGQSEKCSVRLVQQSVADESATLTATRENGKLVMRILGREGLKVNGFCTKGIVTCHDRDIISVGEAYQLLLLMADTQRYGLEPAGNFEADTALTIIMDSNPQEQEDGTVIM